MNSLSWLFYFADIFQNIGNFSIFIMWVSLALFAFFSALKLIESASEKQDVLTLKAFNEIQKFAMIAFFVSLIGLLIPSKETMYMIIASESAEIVISDPTTRELMSDVQEIISLQLESLKPQAPSN